MTAIPEGVVSLAQIIRPNGLLANFSDDSAVYEGLRVKDGSFRIAGASLTTSLTSDVAAFTLSNPAASTVNLVLRAVRLYASAALTLNKFVADATNTGTVQAAFNPLIGSAATTAGQLIAGVNTLTGGTTLSLTANVSTTIPYIVDTFIVIPPGHSMTLGFSGLAATVNGNAHWIEAAF